ncbi:MAG: oligosaccharide flippase family protein [Anaerolineales bacterium]
MFEKRVRLLWARLLENELIRRVLKNSAYLFSATGVSAAMSMLQGMLATRILGVAGFGLLGTITSFTTLINKLASFRMNELVVKYVGQYHEQGDAPRAAAIFKAAALAEMCTSLVAYALLWMLAPLGARFFAKDVAAAPWFALYGLIVLANLISESSTGLLQIFNRFRNLAGLTAVQSVLTLTLIALAARTGGGLPQVIVAYMLGKMLGALLLTGAALREAARRWGKDWWRVPLNLLLPQRGELLRFGLSTNLSATLSLVNKDSELLWVSLLSSPLQTGYYKLALALANLVALPISPLPQATYPELAREVARKNWENVRYILRQGSRLAFGYTFTASLGLAILGQPLIRYAYTPEFLPAYGGLLVLLAGFLVANTFYWQRTALLAIGLPGFPARVNLVLAFFKIIGVILFVPRYGYLASAAMLSLSYIFGVLVSVWRFYAEIRDK